MTRRTIEVKYEWTGTYVIVGDDEDAAIEHAVILAKEELANTFEAGPPSASEFEVYVLDY